MEYSIRVITCKDGKQRKAVVNSFGRIVSFDLLTVYIVENINSRKENV